MPAMLPPGRLLVIADGDLPGLLACAAAGDRSVSTPAGPHLAWLPPTNDPAAPFRRRAAERQADLYGLSVIVGPTQPPDSANTNPGEQETRLLIDAASAAVRLTADAVLWPIISGSDLDLDRTATALDRALLVERLIGLDTSPPPTRVTAPYADLIDRQLADLVIDMDLPVWTCWWWELATADRVSQGAAAPPAPALDAAIAQFTRWMSVLRHAGWSPRPSPSPGAVPSDHPVRPGPPPAAANR